MQHVVFGAGLIGGYLGAALMKSQQNVGWVVRSATQEKLSSGLRVTDYLNHDEQVTDLNFIDPHSSIQREPVKYLWLTIKCTALEKAMDDIRPLLAPDTLIICLQNGLGAESFVQSAFPDHRVIRGVMAANVAELEAGHLHRGTLGGIDLPRSADTEDLQSSFQFDGLPLSLYDNLEGLLWAKLQLNLNNPINALSNIPLKNELSQRAYRQVLAAAIDELIQVAAAKGIRLPKLTPLPPAWISTVMRLPDWLFVRVSAKMLAIDPKARSSMWSDLSDNRVTEIDFINGAIVREGEALGIHCPVNKAITELVHQVERGEKEMGIDAQRLKSLVLK